jgi:hypothetical protein
VAHVSVTAGDGEIRALAARVLDGPDYASWRPARWLEGLLRWLVAFAERSPALYWAMVGGLALLTVALCVQVFRSMRAALRVGGARTPAPPAALPPRFADDAAALAAAGAFLEAARRLQLAVLDLLLRHRVLELGRADANRALRDRVRRAPLPDVERADLLALIDRFERAWFRDRTEDPALYADWRSLHARLAGSVGPA